MYYENLPMHQKWLDDFWRSAWMQRKERPTQNRVILKCKPNKFFDLIQVLTDQLRESVVHAGILQVFIEGPIFLHWK